MSPFRPLLGRPFLRGGAIRASGGPDEPPVVIRALFQPVGTYVCRIDGVPTKGSLELWKEGPPVAI